VIDMVRDYAAIGMGAAQATTTRVADVGRTGAQVVAALVRPEPATRSATGRVPAAGLGEQLSRKRDAVAALLRGDVGRFTNELGLVHESEVRALRQQVSRLERRLGDLRGER